MLPLTRLQAHTDQEEDEEEEEGAGEAVHDGGGGGDRHLDQSGAPSLVQIRRNIVL